MGRVEEKVALITGGASGIGKAIAEALAKEGAKICIADLSQKKCDQVAAEIGRDAIGLEIDVCSQASIDSVVDAVVHHFGAINVLINSAGVFGMQSVIDITPEEFDRIVGVNTRGTLFVSQAVIKAMLKGNNLGSIINIVSGAGRKASPGAAVYSLSKAAVINFTQCAAQELAKNNIRVNAIAPGTTDTPMWEDVRRIFKDVQGGSPDEAIVAETPASRLGVPADFVGAAIYLASDESSFMLGQTLSIDGGYVLG